MAATKNDVIWDRAVPSAIPSILIPKPNTKPILRMMLSTLLSIAINIGIRAFCMPMNHPLKAYIPNTAGAPQTTIRKYVFTCCTDSGPDFISLKASYPIGY